MDYESKVYSIKTQLANYLEQSDVIDLDIVDVEDMCGELIEAVRNYEMNL